MSNFSVKFLDLEQVCKLHYQQARYRQGRHGRDRLVVGFIDTCTYAVSVYNH